MRLYRNELVEALLKAGIPLLKVNSLRPFVEKYGHRLTSRIHLAEFIPMIRQKEIDFVKSEIAANNLEKHWQLSFASLKKIGIYSRGFSN